MYVGSVAKVSAEPKRKVWPERYEDSCHLIVTTVFPQWIIVPKVPGSLSFVP